MLMSKLGMPLFTGCQPHRRVTAPGLLYMLEPAMFTSRLGMSLFTGLLAPQKSHCPQTTIHVGSWNQQCLHLNWVCHCLQACQPHQKSHCPPRPLYMLEPAMFTSELGMSLFTGLLPPQKSHCPPGPLYMLEPAMFTSRLGMSLFTGLPAPQKSHCPPDHYTCWNQQCLRLDWVCLVYRLAGPTEESLPPRPLSMLEPAMLMSRLLLSLFTGLPAPQKSHCHPDHYTCWNQQCLHLDWFCLCLHACRPHRRVTAPPDHYSCWNQQC